MQPGLPSLQAEGGPATRLIWGSRRAGAEVHRGAIDDLDSLRSGAGATDGVIHLAFNNISETTDFAASSHERGPLG